MHLGCWRRPVKVVETEMRHNWYCVTDLPSREDAPATKPLGLIRENDDLATTGRAEIVVNPHDPSKCWDYFGGTD